VRDIMVSAIPLEHTGGTAAALAVHVDITDRKRAEADRARLLASETGARAAAEAALLRMRAIETITDAALSHLGLDALLSELLVRLRSTLHADIASVRLIDEARGELYTRAIEGIPLERVAHIRIPLSAVDLSGPFLSNDVQPPVPDDRGWYAEAWRAMGPMRAGMSMPLVVEGRPIGLVGVAAVRGPLTEDDLLLLKVVASRVAPAIERGKLVETVRAGRERLRLMSRQLLMVQEEERRRIAVELHDELGQALTAVKINLESLERKSGEAAVNGRLEAIRSVDHAMQRVRNLALELRPSVLDDLGLPAALRWYVDRFARDSRVEAHLSIDAIPPLPADVETACFRVAQEALTNVTRHAQARQVWLELRLLPDGLELRVADDGVGFDAVAARDRAIHGGSLGLLGMQERVSLVGGSYSLRSATGAGSELRARFPVSERPSGSA
jgi:signal transduction histidine kinase